jgi:hypothetical protein
MISHDDFGIANDEEMARFQKALTPCRGCNHPKMAHSFLGPFKGTGKCVDARVTVSGMYKQCTCRNFEPKDNLEFLEYKYDKKKGGK